MDARILNKIQEHYRHAVEKHPDFCHAVTSITPAYAGKYLETSRSNMAMRSSRGERTPWDILLCEWDEVIEAYARGANDQAVEECYDAIAVLLRTIDVLEGRQTLTPVNTETKESICDSE